MVDTAGREKPVNCDDKLIQWSTLSSANADSLE